MEESQMRSANEKKRKTAELTGEDLTDHPTSASSEAVEELVVATSSSALITSQSSPSRIEIETNAQSQDTMNSDENADKTFKDSKGSMSPDDQLKQLLATSKNVSSREAAIVKTRRLPMERANTKKKNNDDTLSSRQQGPEQSSCTPQSSSSSASKTSKTHAFSSSPPPQTNNPDKEPITQEPRIWKSGREKAAHKKSCAFPNFRPPPDADASCPQLTPGRRGRTEQSPRPRNMPSIGGVRPVNTLAATGVISRSTRAAAPQASNRGHHESERPAKRQRTEGNYVGSSSSSPTEIEDSQRRSFSAHSETSRTFGASKAATSQGLSKYDKGGAVSGPDEHRSREAMLQDGFFKPGIPRQKQNARKNTTEYIKSPKRPCRSLEGVSSSTAVPGKEKFPRHYNREQPRSLDLLDDPIECQSPESSHERTGMTNHSPTQRSQPTQARPIAKSQLSLPSSQAASVLQSQVSSSIDSSAASVADIHADELAEGHETPVSRKGGAHLQGNKGTDAIRQDIPPTKFTASKTRKVMPEFTDYELTGFVMGKYYWQILKSSPSLHLVPDTTFVPDTRTVWKPVKNRMAIPEMTDAELELVIHPTQILAIQFAEDSDKVIITNRRLTSPQKLHKLAIKFSSNEIAKSFVEALKRCNSDIRIKKDTGEKLNDIYTRSISDALAAQERRPADIQLINRRQKQRSLQSQEVSIPSSTTARANKTVKPGKFYQILQDSIQASTNDQVENQEPGSSQYEAQDKSRRMTREMTKARNFKGRDEKEIGPPAPPAPPPLWTSCNPGWEKRWISPDIPLNYPPDGRNKAEVNLKDIERLNEGELLNDNLIAFYLRYIQETFRREESPEFFQKIHFHNSFFYLSLTKGSQGKPGFNYDGIKKWTAKVDLFDKDFIVVPINEASHWYLAIIHNASALKKHKAEAPVQEAQTASGEEDNPEDQSRPRIRAKSSLPSVHPDEGLEVKFEGDLPETKKLKIKVDQKPYESAVSQNQDAPHESFSESGAKQQVLKIEVPDSQSNSPKEEFLEDLLSNSEQQASLGDHAVRENDPEQKTTRSSRVRRDPERPANDNDKVTIIILDSLGIQHRPTVANLKNWLTLEAQHKLGISVDKSSFKALYPTSKCIPQQDNFCDCGLFLLAYTEILLRQSATFIHRLLSGGMSTGDWSMLSASKMRDFIRNLIFDEKEKQESRKTLLPEKSNKLLEEGKSQKLESSSRESSVLQGKRLCHGSDSSGQQLLHDQSRPISAGSIMDANISSKLESFSIDVDRQDTSKAAMSDAKKQSTSEETMSVSKGPKRDRNKSPDSVLRGRTSLTKTNASSAPKKHDCSNSNGLESLQHRSRDSQEKMTLGPTQDPGNHNTIDLEGPGDEVSSSSTMMAEETLVKKPKSDLKADRTEVLPESPLKKDQVSLSQSHEELSLIREVRKPRKVRTSPIRESDLAEHQREPVRHSPHANDSQDPMLLDDDNFLTRPENPGAVTDFLPSVPRTPSGPRAFNGTRSPAPAKSPKVDANESAADPKRRRDRSKHATYRVKCRNQAPRANSKANVINLEDD